MEFKDMINQRRTELNMTMEELAKLIGVSTPTIQRYESGEIKNVRRDKIKLLSDALQCSPAYLMGWEEKPQSQNSMSKAETEHLHKYRSIDSKGKHTVDTVLEMEYIRCNEHQYTDEKIIDIKQSNKKKYIPTEEDIHSLVARNGKQMTREEAIEFISSMYDDEDDDE